MFLFLTRKHEKQTEKENYVIYMKPHRFIIYKITNFIGYIRKLRYFCNEYYQLYRKKTQIHTNMLRIAIQSKGRLYEDCMNLLAEADIKVSPSKRTLLVQSTNFPLEVLFLRDDDIPQSVASGVADIGIVGENEYEERQENAQIIDRLGFSKCRLSLAIPKAANYEGLEWFNGKKIATSYPGILKRFLNKNNIHADIHVITGSVEISPGIGLADAIFDIVSSGSTLVHNNLKEVEVVIKSEALLIGNLNMDEEKHDILNEMLFRFKAVRSAQDKKYVMMNAPKDKLADIAAVLQE